MTDKVTETWLSVPLRVTNKGTQDACLIHIYPSGPTMGRRFPLGADPHTLGRGEGCDIRIQDNSVSRRHAKIELVPEGYFVCDLGSTNGTFVNDQRTNGPQQLHDSDYLRIGNCIYRFLEGGNMEAEYHEEIYRLTIIDALTQLHNRRYLTDFLERELARSIRHQRPLSVLMFDLDSFKAINDQHGHVCGDCVLREIGERVRRTVRREDLFARYGGEEFSMVLVETNLEAAIGAAERVRTLVGNTPFVFGNQTLNVTVSVGVATTQGEEGLTTPELIHRADEKLYAAKRSGRNRVVS